MTETLQNEDVSTRVVGPALRRFGLRILAVGIIFGAAAGVYAYMGPHSYKSTATVLIQPLPGNALSAQTATGSQASTVAMQTEASLVTSVGVTQRVNSSLHTALPSANSAVSSTVPPNSQVVQISYTARSAQDARRRVDAYAQAFLDYRAAVAAQSQKALLSRLNTRVAAVKKDLQQALLDAAKTVNRPADASTRVHLYTSNLSSLQSEIGSAESTSTAPGTVITPGELPKSPSGLSPPLLIAIGVIVGLALATAVALWRERSDDRIQARLEPTLLGLPVLAVLPDGRPRQPAARPEDDATPQRTEALRRARTSLLALTPLKSVIAITGLAHGEKAAGAGAELAIALNAAGYRVSLVDAADPREDRPEWLVGGRGLADVLAGPMPDRLPLRVTRGVRFLSAGTEPGKASDRYAGQRVRELIHHLQRESDYVLVATAPADTAEGMAMLLAVDGVVLLATDRSTTHEQLRSTSAAVQRLGTSVVGMIVERHKKRGSRAAAKTTSTSSAKAAPETVPDDQAKTTEHAVRTTEPAAEEPVEDDARPPHGERGRERADAARPGQSEPHYQQRRPPRDRRESAPGYTGRRDRRG